MMSFNLLGLKPKSHVLDILQNWWLLHKFIMGPFQYKDRYLRILTPNARLIALKSPRIFLHLT